MYRAFSMVKEKNQNFFCCLPWRNNSRSKCYAENISFYGACSVVTENARNTQKNTSNMFQGPFLLPFTVTFQWSFSLWGQLRTVLKNSVWNQKYYPCDSDWGYSVVKFQWSFCKKTVFTLVCKSIVSRQEMTILMIDWRHFTVTFQWSLQKQQIC